MLSCILVLFSWKIAIFSNSSSYCAGTRSFRLPYLCENSSNVSSPCSELLCIADELNWDLAQIDDVVGATRAALGAALNAGRAIDAAGRAATRRKLKAIGLAGEGMSGVGYGFVKLLLIWVTCYSRKVTFTSSQGTSLSHVIVSFSTLLIGSCTFISISVHF